MCTTRSVQSDTFALHISGKKVKYLQRNLLIRTFPSAASSAELHCKGKQPGLISSTRERLRLQGVKGRRLNPPRQAGAIIIPPHYGLSLAPFLSFFFFFLGSMFVVAEARLVKLQGILGNRHYEQAHNQKEGGIENYSA